MAKPTDTIQQIATDTNFSTSPVVAVNGQPTKVALATPAEGLIPGKAAGAANLNWLWNIANKFLQWVADGTDQPDATAHLVETDSTGLISAAHITVPANGNFLGITAGCDNAAADSVAIRGTHITDGLGVQGRSQFGTGTGVEGLCDGTGGDGVRGRAAGSGAGAGVHGQGFGSAKAGVWAERTQDNDLPALLVSGSHAAPARALVNIGTQATEPSTLVLGDVYVSAVDYRIVQGGAWRTIGSRVNGWVDAVADDAGPVTISTGSYSDVETIAVTPPRVGKVVITATMNVLPVSGSTTGLLLRIRDATAGTTIVADTLAGPEEGHRIMRATYTLPSSGARTFSVQGQAVGDNVNASMITLDVQGVY
jgi:hypothetical protein